jgi:3',5'-cyclic-AMP phosphodiesterase
MQNRNQITRRGILSGAAALVPAARAVAASSSFSFIHFTDLHIQPERRAAAGVAQCVERMNRIKGVDFALCGGDIVFDAAEVQFARAKQVFDLYKETLKPLQMKVYAAPGNHDVFGVSSKSGIAPTDPNYGKKMFEDRIGPRYSSFTHKGWHFVMLDSIGVKPATGRDFIGVVDQEQVAWLKADLAKMPAGMPVVVTTHVPLVSGAMQILPDPWKTAETYLITNSREVLEILWKYNVKAVLQGHTHIRERVVYKDCQFITSGAVCGNWWKGLREGHPEGFGVLTVRDQQLDWRYETYGFQADPA